MNDAAQPNEQSLLPPWEAFKADYVEAGIPCLYAVSANPEVQVFTDAGAARLGFRIELTDPNAKPAPSQLQEIVISEVTVEGKRHLEVSTASKALFPNFYYLAADTLADFAGGASALASLEASISRWEALLDQVPVLSEERQAGLFGELWFLGQLIQQHGDIAVQSWTGPTRQAHDFRIGNFEFEVKTTNSSKRVHTINGLGQLEPSPDCTLYLISIQVGDAGSGGETLADQIDEIANTIISESAKAAFSSLLERAGYRAKDAALYPKRRRLRSEPTAIHVIDGVPRLTHAAVAGVPSAYAPALISGVIYNIDVSGLGVPASHSDFQNVIQCASGGVEE